MAIKFEDNKGGGKPASKRLPNAPAAPAQEPEAAEPPATKAGKADAKRKGR